MSGKASLQYKDTSPDTQDQLQWKWSKGSLTSKAEFGTPLSTTSYQLCIYDGTPSLIFDVTIPAGGLCNMANPKPCWKDKPKGFDYRNKDITPDSVEQLKLQEGLVAGKAQIQVKGKSSPLDDPPLPFAQPVIVQLHNAESGLCWEAVYSAPASKNVAGPPVGQFKDKADSRRRNDAVERRVDRGGGGRGAKHPRWQARHPSPPGVVGEPFQEPQVIAREIVSSVVSTLAAIDRERARWWQARESRETKGLDAREWGYLFLRPWLCDAAALSDLSSVCVCTVTFRHPFPGARRDKVLSDAVRRTLGRAGVVMRPAPKVEGQHRGPHDCRSDRIARYNR